MDESVIRMETYDERDVLPEQPGVENLDIRYDAQDDEYLATVNVSCDRDEVTAALDEFGYTGDMSVAPSKLVLRTDAPDDDLTTLEELEAVRSLGAVALTAAAYDSDELQEHADAFDEHFGDDQPAEEYDLLDTDHHTYDDLMDTRLR